MDSTTLPSPALPYPPIHSTPLHSVVDPLHPARGSGERCKLRERGLGQSRIRILYFGAI